MPGASATGYFAPARRTMARAAAGDGSLTSMPRKWIRVRSVSATEANVPSSAWQATQVDWNQLTTAGPAAEHCRSDPRSIAEAAEIEARRLGRRRSRGRGSRISVSCVSREITVAYATNPAPANTKRREPNSGGTLRSWAALFRPRRG